MDALSVALLITAAVAASAALVLVDRRIRRLQAEAAVIERRLREIGAMFSTSDHDR